MEEMLIWVTLAPHVFLCSIAIANGYYQEGVGKEERHMGQQHLHRDVGWDQVEVLCLLN